MRSVPLVLLLLCAIGCVSALREPPALSEMTGSAAAESEMQARLLMADAARDYASRERAAVRRAADGWIEAAAVESLRTESLIGAVRARVWLADKEPEPKIRRAEAISAVQTAQWCRRTAPADSRCSYWLALALAVQARERRATALDALPRIIELLQQVVESDSGLDDAGAHRTLALIYSRAPGWPTGPGDPELALEQARSALRLVPDHPPNLLALAEARQATGDREGGRETYALALRIALERVESGVPDAADWRDEARRGLAR